MESTRTEMAGLPIGFDSMVDTFVCVNESSRMRPMKSCRGCIRTLSPGIVIEDGTTIAASDTTGTVRTTFTSILVKTNDRWLIASIRDHVVTE